VSPPLHQRPAQQLRFQTATRLTRGLHNNCGFETAVVVQASGESGCIFPQEYASFYIAVDLQVFGSVVPQIYVTFEIAVDVRASSRVL